MGGGYSFSQTASHIYPLYFTQDKPTEEDGAAAKRVWELVKTDSGNRYKDMKQNPEFDKMSTLSWFYEAFYERLFDIHPSSRAQFKQNIIVQGKALVNMISAALSLLNKPVELTKALEGLAKMHTTRGVMANQYGIVGECLLWTFDHCLGEQFTEDAKIGWIRIYSFMIDIIIPVALSEERKLLNAQKNDKNSKTLTKTSSSVSLGSPGSPAKSQASTTLSD